MASLVEAPLQRIGLLANGSLRVEPYATDLTVVAPEANSASATRNIRPFLELSLAPQRGLRGGCAPAFEGRRARSGSNVGHDLIARTARPEWMRARVCSGYAGDLGGYGSPSGWPSRRSSLHGRDARLAGRRTRSLLGHRVCAAVGFSPSASFADGYSRPRGSFVARAMCRRAGHRGWWSIIPNIDSRGPPLCAWHDAAARFNALTSRDRAPK